MRYAHKIIIPLSIILIFFGIVSFGFPQEKFSGLPKLYFFYSTGCQHCFKVRNEFMPRIEARYKGTIDIEYLNIDNIENYKLFLRLKESYPLVNKNLPVLFMQGNFLDEDIRNYGQIEEFVAQSLGRTPAPLSSPDEIDLIERFKELTLFTIVTAGLIDGINPCAFTVIVFFVAFLSVQRYRRREILAVGLFFIFAVFMTYFLLGMGALRILYSVQGFYIVRKSIYLAAALACFIFFAFTLWDIAVFIKTGDTEKIILRLPDGVKNLIHRIIGRYYRRKEEAGKAGIAWLSVSAIACGFLVSILEAVCTGQVYLPTIAFVLKTSGLKIRAFTYLLVYNMMFILPLIIIFLLALLGVTSGQFAKFLQRHMALIKVLLALVFLGLGVILIMRV